MCVYIYKHIHTHIHTKHMNATKYIKNTVRTYKEPG